MENPAKKKIKWWQIALIVVIVFTVIGAIGGNKGKDETATQANATNNSETSDSKPKEEAPKTIAFEEQFSSGFYTVGTDLPAGKYNLEAVAGGGNVMSSDLSINAIMGVKDKNTQIGTDMYQQTYSNIKLSEGITLLISGATIKLTCDKADGKPLTPRNQTIKDSVTLKNGNFEPGTDFPEGVYDITAVSGGGNVMTADAKLNAIMGTEENNTKIGTDMYQQSFKNVEFKAGNTLTLSSVEVKLTPSK